MTHKHFQRQSHHSLREARLLFVGEPNGGNELNRLYQRESVAGDEVEKNRHAYDNVQQRLQTYRNRVQELYGRMQQGEATTRQQRDVLSFINRPENADRERQAVFTHPRYPGQTFGRDAQGNILVMTAPGRGRPAGIPAEQFYQEAMIISANGQSMTPTPYTQYNFSRYFQTFQSNTVNDISSGRLSSAMANATRERTSRIYWNVQNLERHYAECERIIGVLERTVGDQGPNTLSARMLASRTQSLESQIRATDVRDQLQTIHLDDYNDPFTNIRERAYHLLRLPSDVQANFHVPGTETRYSAGTEILLSGGAKYYKLNAANIDDNWRIELRRGGQVFQTGTISRSSDGLNNLIFNFQRPTPRPQPAPEVRPPTPRPDVPFEIPTRGSTVPPRPRSPREDPPPEPAPEIQWEIPFSGPASGPQFPGARSATSGTSPQLAQSWVPSAANVPPMSTPQQPAPSIDTPPTPSPSESQTTPPTNTTPDPFASGAPNPAIESFYNQTQQQAASPSTPDPFASAGNPALTNFYDQLQQESANVAPTAPTATTPSAPAPRINGGSNTNPSEMRTDTSNVSPAFAQTWRRFLEFFQRKPDEK